MAETTPYPSVSVSTPADKPSAKDVKVKQAEKDLEAKQKELDKAVEAQSKAHADYTNAQRELVRVQSLPEKEE